MRKIKALVLAGGFGTRLQPLTAHTPKPLLPIGGKPAIEYLLDSLLAAGVRDITISVNKQFVPAIKSRLEASGINVKFFEEDAPNDASKPGAVGAIYNALKSLDPEAHYLILGSDNFAPNFDFKKFIASADNSVAHIAVYKMPDKETLSQYGVVELTGSRIVGFQEKPTEPKSDVVSTAHYLVSPEFLTKWVPKYIALQTAAGQKADNAGHMFQTLLKMGAPLTAYVFEDFWADIGKPQEYLRASEHILELQGSVIHPTAEIHPTAKIVWPVRIEERVRIGPGAVVGPHTHLMAGSTVGKGAVVEKSLIFHNAFVGVGAVVKEAIVDRKTIHKGRAERHKIISRTYS